MKVNPRTGEALGIYKKRAPQSHIIPSEELPLEDIPLATELISSENPPDTLSTFLDIIPELTILPDKLESIPKRRRKKK